MIIDIPIQLRGGESQRIIDPRIVAAQTFGAAVETPIMLAMAARRSRVLDVEHLGIARGVHERCVGLLVVPALGIGAPVQAVVMEDL